MRKEIVIVGQGGQGILLMGEILAKAAHFEQKEVACTSSYGAAARGEVTVSEAVVSDEPIDFPGVLKIDFLIAMSQKGYDELISRVWPESKIFFDSDAVKAAEQAKAGHIQIPALKTASELGSRMAANMVMLGAVAAVTELISFESLSEIIKEETGRFAEVNLKALKEGYKLGKQYLMQKG